MGTERKIARALISVTDKTGVVDFARALVEEFGVEIVSTGGTAKAIEEAGVPVRPIEDFTGYPEMMDGRVKTLHPKVHGALLARRDSEEHMAQAAEHGIQLIDMILFNMLDRLLFLTEITTAIRAICHNKYPPPVFSYKNVPGESKRIYRDIRIAILF